MSVDFFTANALSHSLLLPSLSFAFSYSDPSLHSSFSLARTAIAHSVSSLSRISSQHAIPLITILGVSSQSARFLVLLVSLLSSFLSHQTVRISVHSLTRPSLLAPASAVILCNTLYLAFSPVSPFSFLSLFFLCVYLILSHHSSSYYLILSHTISYYLIVSHHSSSYSSSSPLILLCMLFSALRICSRSLATSPLINIQSKNSESAKTCSRKLPSARVSSVHIARLDCAAAVVVCSAISRSRSERRKGR